MLLRNIMKEKQTVYRFCIPSLSKCMMDRGIRLGLDRIGTQAVSFKKQIAILRDE